MVDVGKQGMAWKVGSDHWVVPSGYVHGIACAAMWADEGTDIGQVSGL